MENGYTATSSLLKNGKEIKITPSNETRCQFCHRTQLDWDNVGREWAEENKTAGYGVPGFIQVDSKPICEYCALDITRAFAAVRPDMAKEEVNGAWHRHKLKTDSQG